jgi:hypothetical protein
MASREFLMAPRREAEEFRAAGNGRIGPGAMALA